MASSPFVINPSGMSAIAPSVANPASTIPPAGFTSVFSISDPGPVNARLASSSCLCLS